MKIIRRIMSSVIIIAGIFLLAFVAGSVVGFDKVWQRVAGDPDLGQVEFRGFEKGPNPNQALVCPNGLCNDSDVDIDSPVYALSAVALAVKARDALAAMEGGQRVDNNQVSTQVRFVFRSRLMKYPDTLSLTTIEGRVANTSRIAIYSRSQLGKSDLGVNLKRTQALLAALKSDENN